VLRRRCRCGKSLNKPRDKSSSIISLMLIKIEGKKATGAMLSGRNKET
jgi:hypothetical protein